MLHSPIKEIMLRKIDKIETNHHRRDIWAKDTEKEKQMEYTQENVEGFI